MTGLDNTFKAAHGHSSGHRAELLASETCGCFFCCSTFKPSEILDWICEIEDVAAEDDTALCPRCGVDSVIGSKSGYPVTSADFLNDMHAYWFGRTVHA